MKEGEIWTLRKTADRYFSNFQLRLEGVYIIRWDLDEFFYVSCFKKISDQKVALLGCFDFDF
jgi:hypothetical protein